ncbi:helix-turn-helix domain-containing protein [Streptomyces avermitilis]
MGVSRWHEVSRRGTAKQRAQRDQVRLEDAELFVQGVVPPQVARRLRVSRKSAYPWHARWSEGRVRALRSKGPSGRPSRMQPAWRGWLAAELEKGPDAHGWVEDQRWTLARVATVIALLSMSASARHRPGASCTRWVGRCRSPCAGPPSATRTPWPPRRAPSTSSS